MVFAQLETYEVLDPLAFYWAETWVGTCWAGTIEVPVAWLETQVGTP